MSKPKQTHRCGVVCPGSSISINNDDGSCWNLNVQADEWVTFIVEIPDVHYCPYCGMKLTAEEKS